MYLTYSPIYARVEARTICCECASLVIKNLLYSAVILSTIFADISGSCVAAGFTECCPGGIVNCAGDPAACFCDINCLFFQDCCHDFFDICAGVFNNLIIQAYRYLHTHMCTH